MIIATATLYVVAIQNHLSANIRVFTKQEAAALTMTVAVIANCVAEIEPLTPLLGQLHEDLLPTRTDPIDFAWGLGGGAFTAATMLGTKQRPVAGQAQAIKPKV